MLVLACMAGAGPAANAQSRRVPVIVAEGEIGCFPGHIVGLERADGFLAVRAGPSPRQRELARLYNNDLVFTCQRSGRWIGIVYAERGSNMECGVHGRWVLTQAYTGPCRWGWVHRNYVAVADLFDDSLADEDPGR